GLSMVRARSPESKLPGQPGPRLGGFHQPQRFGYHFENGELVVDSLVNTGTWKWDHPKPCGAKLRDPAAVLVQLVARHMAAGKHQVRLP
ncbi:MAG TPA: hypothetical protein VH112_12500, partial [Acidimicrobiales bacterium]|nr:hypothetical protein [Acidimicrobiales bacterium]